MMGRPSEMPIAARRPPEQTEDQIGHAATPTDAAARVRSARSQPAPSRSRTANIAAVIDEKTPPAASGKRLPPMQTAIEIAGTTEDQHSNRSAERSKENTSSEANSVGLREQGSGNTGIEGGQRIDRDQNGG